jgi:hypothetical protein
MLEHLNCFSVQPVHVNHTKNVSHQDTKGKFEDNDSGYLKDCILPHIGLKLADNRDVLEKTSRCKDNDPGYP